MKWIKQMFQRSSTSSDPGLYYTITCDYCGAEVVVRVDSRNDVSLNDELSGYFVRKIVVDDRCFRRMELVVTFDSQRRQLSATVDGGSLRSDR